MSPFEIRGWEIEIMEACELKNESHQYQTPIEYGLTEFKTTNIFYE